jgi:hypothetical protein
MLAVPTSRISARAERRAIAALVAVFALLVQALIPSLAMAAASPAFDHGVICADAGHGGFVRNDGSGAPAPHQGAGCDHCVCPTAAAPPSTLAEVAVPVRYAFAATTGLPARQGPTPGRGLAAPPPPSRGPPQLTI